MATPFTLLDGEPLLMELDSSHLAEVRFLGNAIPAPTTRNNKPAKTRRESVPAPYQEMECKFNWNAAILSLARSPALRIVSRAGTLA